MEQWPQPDFTDDLRNLDVLDEVDGALHATLFGLMAFGKEPQAYPQTRSFFVECTAYAGSDRGSEALLTQCTCSMQLSPRSSTTPTADG